jgi:hypothetical protein
LSILFSPGLVLGAVLATGYAALFHLWQKRGLSGLQLYVIAAWIGFALGHIANGLIGIHIVRIGQLNVLGGSIGALIALLIARWIEA